MEAAYRGRQMGESNMFKSHNFETRTTLIIAAIVLAAFLASVLA